MGYFGKDLGYLETIQGIRDFKIPGINYQKNHDFDLQILNTTMYRYVIQYRHPLASIASWYRWELDNLARPEHNTPVRRSVNRHLPIWNLYVRRDTGVRWRRFAVKRLRFWKAFVNKWIIENENPRTFYAPYEDVVMRPKSVLRDLATFLDPKSVVDEALIASVVGREKISIKHHIADFAHFDLDFFRALEGEALGEMETIGIKPRFQA